MDSTSSKSIDFFDEEAEFRETKWNTEEMRQLPQGGKNHDSSATDGLGINVQVTLPHSASCFWTARLGRHATRGNTPSL